MDRLEGGRRGAQAENYRFYCRVPAHAAAGMRGTLTVH